MFSIAPRSRRDTREEQLLCRLHDATEAYLADVPKPVKRIMPDYERIEKSIWARIAHKFFGRAQTRGPEPVL